MVNINKFISMTIAALLVFSLTGCANKTDLENIIKEAAIIHQSDREQVMSSYQYYFTERGLKDFVQLKSISTKDAVIEDAQFFWDDNICTMVATKDNKTGQKYVVIGKITVVHGKIDSLDISSQLDVG